MPAIEEDPSALINALKQRHRARREAWERLRGRRTDLEQAREHRISEPLRRADAASTGRKLATIGGILSRADLYEGGIEFKGKFHALSAEVQATVSEQGGQSSSQGFVFHNQADSRELYVTVQGPDWYLDIRGAKGQTSASHLSGAAANFSYRQETKRAREFAGAVNNAARQFARFQQRVETEKAKAHRKAQAASDDTAAIEAVIREMEEAALDQMPKAMADAEQLAALPVPGRWTSAGRAYRALQKDLPEELRGYEVKPLDRGRLMPPLALDRDKGSNDQDGVRQKELSRLSTVLQQERSQRVIAQLIELRDAGVLSDAEFAEKVADLHR